MRRVGQLLGLLMLPPAFALMAMLVVLGASWSGMAYALGGLVAVLGLVRPRKLWRDQSVARAGLAIIAATAVIRVWTGARGENVTMSVAGGTGAGRLFGRLLDERDAAVAAAYALSMGGLLEDPEASVVPAAMRAAYDRMSASEGDGPSPLLPTYAGLQEPDAFDLLVVDGVEAPAGALVFLHGFAGSFTLPCWQVALLARSAGLVTFCPSVGWRGDWWTAEGEKTLRRTIEIARARGFSRIFLAGLSNGAVGASRLAPRLRGSFQGMILVSCAAPEAGAAGVPTLVLSGRTDRMCPAATARAYAARTGAQYVEVGGGHFALLTHEDESARAIAAWLARSRRGDRKRPLTGT